jgi:hypothetical protein
MGSNEKAYELIYTSAMLSILQAQGKYQSTSRFPTMTVREHAARGSDTSWISSSWTDQPPLPFVLGTEFAGRIAKNSPIPKGCPYRPGGKSDPSYNLLLLLFVLFH